MLSPVPALLGRYLPKNQGDRSVDSRLREKVLSLLPSRLREKVLSLLPSRLREKKVYCAVENSQCRGRPRASPIARQGKCSRRWVCASYEASGWHGARPYIAQPHFTQIYETILIWPRGDGCFFVCLQVPACRLPAERADRTYRPALSLFRGFNPLVELFVFHKGCKVRPFLYTIAANITY